MRVLVTGATGFIGSHVCRGLIVRGIDVYGLVRPGQNPWRIQDIATQMSILECDLFHASERLPDAFPSGLDLCIHCAWYAVPGDYLTSLENVACLHGSLAFISTLAARGCARIAGVGTCAEYALSDTPIDESTPLNPLTLYAAAKASTFLMGAQLAKQACVSFAWGRVFHLYGPGEDPRRLVPDVTMKLLRGQRAATTCGDQVRDFLHVEDVASGLIELAFSDIQGAVNIGSAKPVAVAEVVSILAVLTGHEELVDRGARPDNLIDPPFLCAQNDRLRGGTPWRPKYDLHDGLADAVRWWRNRP